MPDEENVLEPVPTPTPTSIGAIEVSLYDHDGDVANMGASASVRVLDQDGQIMKVKRADDIRKVLTTAEKQGLKALLDKIRARANTLILGGG